MTKFPVFESVHDCDTVLAEVEGEIYLIYPGDPSEEGIVPELVYSKWSWESASAPEGEIDADGDVGFLDGWGRPYRWVKPRFATSEVEAADFVRRWNEQ